MKFNFHSTILFEFTIQALPIPASIVLNRLLGSSDRGQLAELLLIPSIVSTIIACNWDKILKGEILSTKKTFESIITRTYNLFIFQYLSVLLIGLLLYSSGTWVANLDWPIVIVVILIHGFLQLVSNYLIAIFSCYFNSNKLYYVKLSASILYLVIVLIFSYFGEINLINAFILNMTIPFLYIMSIFVVAKINRFYFPKKIQLNFQDFILRIKTIPVILIDTISNNLDLIILSNFVQHGYLGAYISFKILEFPFKIISQAFINQITPLISSMSILTIKKYIFYVIILIIIFCFAILLLESTVNYFVLYLLGNSYAEYVWMTTYVVIIGALYGIFSILQNMFLLYSCLEIYNKTVYIGSSLKIFLLPIFFYYYNVIGLFYGIIVFLFIVNLYSIYLFLKIQSKNFNIYK